MTLALLASASGIAAFQVARSIAFLRVEGRLVAAVQAAVWDRLLNLPAPFFRSYSAGDLAMRAMGIEMIRQLISGPVVASLLALVLSIFSYAVLFAFEPMLAWAATGIIALAVAVTGVIGYLQLRQQRIIHVGDLL